VVAERRLALVGQPNVGKSVLFQALTGRYVMVSNYPGTTVEVARGVGTIGGTSWEVVDTPGLRSLLPRSEDERVARDVLWQSPPDVIAQVADGKALRRALHLTFELAQLRLPMVLVLNLADEARDRGFRVDTRRLARRLGFPVVETVAVTGEGLADLRRSLAEAAVYAGPAVEPPEVRSAVDRLEALLPDRPGRRAAAEALLAGEPAVQAPAGGPEADVAQAARLARERFAAAPSLVLFGWREALAEELAAEVSAQSARRTPHWLEALGMALLRPLPGSLAALATLVLLYLFVGRLAAQDAVDVLEERLFGALLVPAVTAAVGVLPLPVWAADLLVGPLGLVTMGLTYALAIVLPVVAAFFLFFSFLEDSGYLPRLSVLLDRVFRRIGLNGKAVFPMILGLGCGTMATLTTRVLESRRERVLVTLLLALAIPCSAQLGVVMGLLSGLAPWAALVFVGTVASTGLAVGRAASLLLPGARAPFWIEIPPLRVPRPRNLLSKVWTRVVWYLREAVPLFLLGTFVLWVLDRTGGLRRLESALSPLVTGWLGLPAEATFALLGGFLRRDYGAAGFFALAREGRLDAGQVVVSLVTLTLFVPCFAQLLVMIKERGLRAALATAAVVTGLALLAGGLVRALLSLAGAS
jgi:ferrous iron transport protein B